MSVRVPGATEGNVVRPSGGPENPCVRSRGTLRPVHPIEHLRHVARAQGVPWRVVVDEAAAALVGLCGDPRGVVVACQRIVARHPGCAPLVWLAARALASGDPCSEIDAVVDDLDADATPQVLAGALPPDATVVVLGVPPEALGGLGSRGDLTVVVVDALGNADRTAARVGRLGIAVEIVPPEASGAVLGGDQRVVLIAPEAVGPTSMLVPLGSGPLVAAAHLGGVPVWAVAGPGRVLPEVMWDGFVAAAMTPGPSGWTSGFEVVPVTRVDALVCPGGVVPAPEGAANPDCPGEPGVFAGTVV